LISFTVLEVKDKAIITTVDNDATLGENKIATVHGMRSNLDNPFLTYQDTLDMDFAVTHGLDFVTVSYAAKAADIEEIRALPGVAESGIKIYAKVQNKEAIDNFDNLLAVADGVQISRSSIANEIPVEKVAYVQKTLIRKCNLAGKPVLVANQILNSMEKNPRPTRAECTDIANAVFEGADTIILTNTTGQPNCAYPVKSIKVLRQQCLEVETKLIKYRELYAAIRDYMLYEEPEHITLAESVTSSAVKTAWDLDATLIIVLSENGDALRFVSKYRPHTPIYCVTSNPQVARQVLLSRGAVPYLTDSIPTGDVLPIVQAAIKKAKDVNLVAGGEYAIAISGIDADSSRETNMYQVVRCE
jgi:pyruvate kinase